MDTYEDELRARRIETTKHNPAEARRIGDQEWINAELAILQSLGGEE